MAHGYAAADLLQNVRLALRHQGCAVTPSEVARLLALQPQSVDWYFQRFGFRPMGFQRMGCQRLDFQGLGFQQMDFQRLDFLGMDLQRMEFNGVVFQRMGFQPVDSQGVAVP